MNIAYIFDRSLAILALCDLLSSHFSSWPVNDESPIGKAAVVRLASPFYIGKEKIAAPFYHLIFLSNICPPGLSGKPPQVSIHPTCVV